MKINRILYPITSLGPGKRLVIYTQGCNHNCYNCASPELHSFDEIKEVDVFSLYRAINDGIGNAQVDGITITGGDPMQQPIDELLQLLELLNNITEDIIIYTGYTYHEIFELMTSEQLFRFQSLISLLIDGRYIDKLNTPNLTLRGSLNQKFRLFNESYERRYKEYLENGRRIQNVITPNGEIISVGIHSKENE